MVSNTQRIETLEKRLGELDGLDERVRDLSSTSHNSGSSDANNRIAALEKENRVGEKKHSNRYFCFPSVGRAHRGSGAHAEGTTSFHK